MSYNIRKAQLNDLPAMYELVVELAVYEKEPDAVTATLQDYENNFNDQIFQAFVAEKEGKIIGMALYYLTFSTWNGKMLYLEDFVVTQAHRRKGVGKVLFEAVVLEAKRLNAKRMKWQVLDWNELALGFYKKYEARIEDGWLNCDFSEKQLNNIPLKND